MSNSKAQSVSQDYALTTKLIHRFVDDVSHAESLLQLPFEHNCMNWVLGHIVTNRSHVLETLNIPHPWSVDVQALYHQDTPPIKPDSPAIAIATLVTYLDESLELLEAHLENMIDARLDELHTNYRGEKTRHEHVTGFHWHETFHLGQLEILLAFIRDQRK